MAGDTLQSIINRRYPRASAMEFLGDDSGEEDYGNDDDSGTWHDPNEWTKLITGGLGGFAKILAARKRGSTYTYSETEGGGGVPLTQRFGTGAVNSGVRYDAGGNIITQAGASAGAGVANLGQGLVGFISQNTGLIVIGVVMLMLFKSGRK